MFFLENALMVVAVGVADAVVAIPHRTNIIDTRIFDG